MKNEVQCLGGPKDGFVVHRAAWGGEWPFRIIFDGDDLAAKHWYGVCGNASGVTCYRFMHTQRRRREEIGVEEERHG